MDPPACVLDSGTYQVRAGLAGDDTPRYIAPNCTARPRQQLQVLVADEIFTIKNHAQLEFSRPLERGVLVNAGAQRDVWERCFEKVQCTPRDSRCVVTECAVNPPSARKAMDEILFEDFGFLGRMRLPSSVCAAAKAKEILEDRDRHRVTQHGGKPAEKRIPYAHDCVLICDMGHSASTATPVLGGGAHDYACRRSDVGGQLVTGYLRDLISYRQMDVSDETATIDKLKRDLCYVAQNFDEELALCDGTTKEHGTASKVYAEYVLPDYHSIDAGYARMDTRHPAYDPEERRRRTRPDTTPQFLRVESERFCGPELHFAPQDIGLKQCGLTELVADAILKTPHAMRPSLSAQVILTGGGASFPGLRERLQRELRPYMLAPYDVEVILPRDPELTVFQGAAMLAKNEGQYLSKLDWEEHGADRCLVGFGRPEEPHENGYDDMDEG